MVVVVVVVRCFLCGVVLFDCLCGYVLGVEFAWYCFVWYCFVWFPAWVMFTKDNA